jgi:GPH family glycoside/pentoside/hexuronide:cation symporter
VKLGHAFAIGAFPLLALFGFDPKLPTATGETALIALYAIVPAAMGLVVAAVMLRYPLDATRVAEIQRQLTARDAAMLSPHEPEPDPNVALAAPAE